MEATDAGQLQHQGGTGLAAGLWHAVDGILRARAGGAKGYSANSRSSGSRDLARALGAWLPAAVLRTTWSETTTQDLQVPENSWTTDELSASRTSLGDDSKYLVLLFSHLPPAPTTNCPLPYCMVETETTTLLGFRTGRFRMCWINQMVASKHT